MTEPLPKSGPRRVVVVLGALVVLLIGASVLAITLFAGVRDDRDLESQRLARVSTARSEAQGRLSGTTASIDEVADGIARLEAENAELHKCADPAKDTIIAARDDDDAALCPAVGRASDNC
ncbi:hypothetical protein [Saccharothrix longispora]|uniref:hypothetical protein n=1 Tax=Saccharothrix longispora TaxID=33920 RepID=UPI0028FD8118|nr:hypothetical protein [Saccharothrix longispora]MDU0289046.1 hypothetical protein [Saccharothrix longispora]